jgi:hypothetical protein
MPLATMPSPDEVVLANADQTFAAMGTSPTLARFSMPGTDRQTSTPGRTVAQWPTFNGAGSDMTAAFEPTAVLPVSSLSRDEGDYGNYERMSTSGDDVLLEVVPQRDQPMDTLDSASAHMNDRAQAVAYVVGGGGASATMCPVDTGRLSAIAEASNEYGRSSGTSSSGYTISSSSIDRRRAPLTSTAQQGTPASGGSLSATTPGSAFAHTPAMVGVMHACARAC